MKILRKLYLGLMLFFLYAPISVLIIFSFNKGKSKGSFTGFSFQWYVKLFANTIIMDALKNTILIALTAALAATVIGTAAAIGIDAMGKKTKKVFMALTNLPVMIPDIVMGVSLIDRKSTRLNSSHT